MPIGLKSEISHEFQHKIHFFWPKRLLFVDSAFTLSDGPGKPFALRVEMLRSRTVRTLTILFTAMTIGALSLMWMETAPIDEVPMPLTGLSSSLVMDEAIVYSTHAGVPVQYSKWRNVVLRNAPTADHDIAQACHFIVSDANQAITTTELWKRQIDGYHTFAPGHDWNADSIGVCFVGGLNDETLTGRQFNKLMALVQRLQYRFKIRPERIYLHSELDDRTRPPSGPFVQAFSRGLRQVLPE